MKSLRKINHKRLIKNNFKKSKNKEINDSSNKNDIEMKEKMIDETISIKIDEHTPNTPQ